MHPEFGHAIPPWHEEAGFPDCPPLAGDTSCDVAIVGAGMAGLSTAYQCAMDGRSVVVVEHHAVAGGQSARTTAHLASAIDDRFHHLEQLHGPVATRLAAESHVAAIDRIEEVVHRERIDCAFERVDGFLFQPPGQPSEVLDQEEAAAKRAGVDVVRVPRAPLPTFDTGPCLRFPRQAQFQPLQYFAGLARAVEERGGRIHERTHALAVHGGPDAHVVTDRGVVKAAHVVVATNVPVNDRVVVVTKQAPYLTYVVAASVPAGAVPHALYWDLDVPYHFARLHTVRARDVERTLLLVGGEDHRSGQAADGAQRFARLEAWMRSHFPLVGAVEWRWSGQVMEPVDGLALIGRNPVDHDNVSIATGDSGMGMTHGTIAGMVIADRIAGRANPWAELYDPARVSFKAVPAYVRENVTTLAQYVGWLRRGEVDQPSQVAAGHGAILRDGLRRIAVHRDEQGRCSLFNAVCPHLGGVVRWNDVERTWDCPCHGSRFDAHGHVIVGPANQDLEPVQETSRARHA